MLVNECAARHLSRGDNRGTHSLLTGNLLYKAQQPPPPWVNRQQSPQFNDTQLATDKPPIRASQVECTRTQLACLLIERERER